MIESKNTSMSLARKAVLGFCALSTVGLMSIQPAFADCTRHFVNQTDKDWKITITDNNNNSDRVMVPAGQTVAYTYTVSLLDVATITKTWAKTIKIRGPQPENYRGDFSLVRQSDGDCVYIDHPDMSNTGSATVNEPANGDLKLWRAD